MKVKNPNSNHQMTNNIQSSNGQYSNRLEFGNWNLEFIWDL